MAENRFFSSVARIQTDRKHVVCDSGPYKFVRHPGYVGNILPLPGIVLALGSIWAVIPAVFTTMIILIRTILEDDMLKKELPGYRIMHSTCMIVCSPGYSSDQGLLNYFRKWTTAGF